MLVAMKTFILRRKTDCFGGIVTFYRVHTYFPPRNDDLPWANALTGSALHKKQGWKRLAGFNKKTSGDVCLRKQVVRLITFIS